MKKTLLYLLTAFPVLATAQVNYHIEGKVGNVTAPAKAFLQYSADGKVQLDSVTLSKGTFSFKGNIAEPLRATVFVLHGGESFSDRNARKDFKSVHLESGSLKITATDSLKNGVVKGGKINTASLALIEKKKPLSEKNREIIQEYNEAESDSINKDRKKEILDRYYANQKLLMQIDLDFVQKNKDNYLSLELLNYNSRELTTGKADTLFRNLSSDLQNIPAGKELLAKINARKSVELGQHAPAFTAPDTLEKDFSLNSLQGKYVLVDFWASWCGPCRRENPNVVAAFEKYQSKNFTVLGVSLDNPGQKEAWLKAIDKDKLQNWPHVSDLKGWQSDIGKLYAIDAIPQNFLLDPQGVIIATNLREEALHEKLEEILK